MAPPLQSLTRPVVAQDAAAQMGSVLAGAHPGFAGHAGLLLGVLRSRSATAAPVRGPELLAEMDRMSSG